jgi:protoporphyrinogen oxidase
MRVTILGGGLAGLSAAYSLAEEGVDVEVLEKEDKVGGLARSFEYDGFTYDLGPHRFHTQDQKIIDHFKRLMGGEFGEKDRVSRILLAGRFFDYPLKVGNAMFTMPPLTTARIVSDYLGIKAKNMFRRVPDDNFENWVVNRFGWKLYDIYFKVYTEKTWGIPCTRLSADWAAQRITLLSLWDTFIKTVNKSKDTPRTYVSRFYYPTSGGIGRLSEEYAKAITGKGGKIRLDSTVRAVRLDGDRIAEVAYDGGTAKIGAEDTVFSTIPVTELVGAITPKPPKEVLDATAKLSFRSIVFVHLMFDRERISNDHWIYLPELKYLANRVSESKNFNEGNAPKGKTIIGAEITCQKGDETWNESADTLAKRVLEDMVAVGLAKREEYAGCRMHHMEHAYPIYDLEYHKNMETVMGYLKTIKNMRFFGRNGLFRYNNMDHSISMGLIAGRSVTDKSMDYMKVATGEHWFG